MSLDLLSRAPARMSLVNIATGADIEAQFNPSEFTESLNVNYARQIVPGLSHQVLQYVNTNNVNVPLNLFFDALAEGATLQILTAAKAFLQHLAYPRRGAQNVVGGAPPRVLLVWPQVLSLTMALTGLAIRHTRFNVGGAATLMIARVTLEEIRDAKLFSADVLVSGSQRSPFAREFGI